jgi:hypothetical protein
MPKTSAISKYVDRTSIDFAIANGVSAVRIARLHGFSESQISRYRKRLLAERPEYVAQLRQPPIELAELQRLHAETVAALDAIDRAQAHFETIKSLGNQ